MKRKSMLGRKLQGRKSSTIPIALTLYWMQDNRTHLGICSNCFSCFYSLISSTFRDLETFCGLIWTDNIYLYLQRWISRSIFKLQLLPRPSQRIRKKCLYRACSMFIYFL